MTPNVGPALPGFASARASSDQSAAGGKKDTGFGEMLGGAVSPVRPEKQPVAETGSREQRWAKLAAAAFGGHGGKGEATTADSGKTASTKGQAAKTAKDSADAKPHKDAADTEEAASDTDTAPLQDDLPLLIAFHDLRHFSTAAKAGGRDTAAGEAAQDPALDGQQPLPKLYQSKSAGREVLETMSKPEQASLVDGPLTALDGKAPGDAGANSAMPKRESATPAQALPSVPAADVPGVQAKHAGPGMKSIEDVQSSMRPEPGKQSSSAGRIDVVSERSFPAPAQNPMSQAALNVVSAIAADGGPQQTLSSPSAAGQLASSVAVPTHMLKIELHPAELGMVTATLRLSGEQLSIELKPETHDAHRRLSADSEAIVKSLRGLGFEVDKVTILQPSVAVPSATRTDATGSLPTATGRDQSSFQPGNSGGNNGGTGGQQPGRNRNDDAQDFGRTASPVRERAGGDMFI